MHLWKTTVYSLRLTAIFQQRMGLFAVCAVLLDFPFFDLGENRPGRWLTEIIKLIRVFPSQGRESWTPPPAIRWSLPRGGLSLPNSNRRPEGKSM